MVGWRRLIVSRFHAILQITILSAFYKIQIKSSLKVSEADLIRLIM